MGKHVRGAVSAIGVLLLMAGTFLLGLGYILRETGLMSTVLLALGALAALEGVFLVLESWFAGRRDL